MPCGPHPLLSFTITHPPPPCATLPQLFPSRLLFTVLYIFPNHLRNHSHTRIMPVTLQLHFLFFFFIIPPTSTSLLFNPSIYSYCSFTGFGSACARTVFFFLVLLPRVNLRLFRYKVVRCQFGYHLLPCLWLIFSSTSPILRLSPTVHVHALRHSYELTMW